MSTAASTILVVDDDPKGLHLLQSLLHGEGYTVLPAEHGAQALVLAYDHRPDVVLLDVMMPDLDGYEVCRRLRADETLRHVPILLLTALDDRESRLRGLEAGADDFISKPFDSVELRTRLRTITRLNRFRQLFEERARFETAVAYSPDAIVLTDDAGRITLVNAAFQRLVAAPATADDASVFDYLVSDELRNQLATLSEVGRRIGPVQLELARARRPDTWVEITAGRLPGPDGSLLEFNIRDITEKKLLEAQLLRSQRIELLGQLAGGIVHDVNNILTAISGNAMLIDGAEPGRVPDYIANIQKSVRRGGSLLRQILMFARGADHELEPTSTALLVHETAALVNEVLGRDIRVAIDAPVDLPDIMADANQLHQVLMNFCVNARDAMPDGGRLSLSTGRVQLDAARAAAIGPDAIAGDFVTLSVRDTGTGITPEVRARLFDPFFTTKPADRGTGLGLATVLRLVRRHSGFVGLETTVGEGSCFTCYFPVPVGISPTA
jgi:PAS domain S-box-containing protein